MADEEIKNRDLNHLPPPLVPLSPELCILSGPDGWYHHISRPEPGNDWPTGFHLPRYGDVCLLWEHSRCSGHPRKQSLFLIPSLP